MIIGKVSEPMPQVIRTQPALYTARFPFFQNIQHFLFSKSSEVSHFEFSFHSKTFRTFSFKIIRSVPLWILILVQNIYLNHQKCHSFQLSGHNTTTRRSQASVRGKRLQKTFALSRFCLNHVTRRKGRGTGFLFQQYNELMGLGTGVNHQNKWSSRIMCSHFFGQFKFFEKLLKCLSFQKNRSFGVIQRSTRQQ